MKKLLFVVAAMLCVVGCEYDDTEIKNSIEQIEKRLSAVETVQNAYKNNLFIKSVVQTTNGYTITFSDGSTATITNGKDGDTLIESITISESEVTFVLTDGRRFSIPLYNALSVTFDVDDTVVVAPNSTLTVGYSVESNIKDIVVEVTSSADIKARVVKEGDLTGKIEIKTGETIDEYSKVIAFVSNGEKVIMRSITFEQEGLQIVDNATKNASAEGGEVVLEYLTNVECEAVIPEDVQSWISVVPATRAMEKQSITLKVESNEGAIRSADVIVKSADGKLSVTYTITQEPDLDYQLALERKALIAIYNALDGDNWTNNENWCSDKPVGEWYGVDCSEGFIWALSLGNNNLKGEIPNEIGNLSNIRLLELNHNQISGMVPKEMRKLNKLHSLNLSYTDISGPFFEGIEGLCDLEILQLVGCPNITSIPENIKYLQKLFSLRVSGIISKRINCSLPSTIGECKALREIEFIWANAENEIPRSIGALSNLTYLNLSNANYKGSIPVEISNCYNLRVLDLQENNLSGGLPAQIGKMNSLRQIILMKNHLTGDIPKSLLDNKTLWSRCWAMVMYGNNFNNCYIPAPQFTVKGYYGNTIHSESLYKSNKYTALIQTNLDSDINSRNINILKEIYDKYKEHGLNVVDCVSCNRYYHGQEYNMVTQYVENYNIPWEVVVLTDDNNLFSADYNLSGWGDWYPLNDSPGIVLIDNSGEVIMYSSQYYGDTGYTKLDNYLSEYLLGIIPTLPYESTDYTKDGSYSLLQRAQTGNGIDIVLMGDGYSDRLIESGDYDNAMDQAMNMFFSNEPYKSYRDLFNVYAVYAVSANEGFETGRESTALNSSFMGGTGIEGNAEKVFKYALKVIDEERMDNASIIVVLNSTNYAGTCYCFNGEYCDYGSGISISYVPIQDGLELFGSTILHEANGHGFAKLADEYSYEYMGEAPADYVSQTKNEQKNWGWWKNVDFTSDTSKVLWSKFIADERYKYDGLGAFEGGLTYWTGVWRPTENSIMRYNTGGFNAPSREAIYYRIHKLAYGDSWQYDYEKFVEYDAINRKTGAEQAAAHTMVLRPFAPTAPPVVVGKTWREALGK